MTRRNIIQQIIYTLIALVFGPEALAKLDLAATEQLVDDVLRPPWCNTWADARKYSDLCQLILGYVSKRVAEDCDGMLNAALDDLDAARALALGGLVLRETSDELKRMVPAATPGDSTAL